MGPLLKCSQFTRGHTLKESCPSQNPSTGHISFPPLSRMMVGLILWRSCAGSHRCCELMSTLLPSCPEDIVSLLSSPDSSSLSAPTSMMVSELWEGVWYRCPCGWVLPQLSSPSESTTVYPFSDEAWGCTNLWEKQQELRGWLYTMSREKRSRFISGT